MIYKVCGFVTLPIVTGGLSDSIMLNTDHILVLREHQHEWPTVRLTDGTLYTLRLTFEEAQQHINQATKMEIA